MHVDWRVLFQALAVGIATGAAFTAIKLPPPVPEAAEGVAGIIGLWLGYLLVVLVRRYLLKS